MVMVLLRMPDKYNDNMYLIQWTKISYTMGTLNPLSPHDALKHHFTSLKTDPIFLQ